MKLFRHSKNLSPRELKVLSLLVALCAGSSLFFGAAAHAATPYWQTTSNGNYGGYPSPTACTINYNGGAVPANCFQGLPAGILSALNLGNSSGTYTAGLYNAGGYAPCYPSTGWWHPAGFAGARNAVPLVVSSGTQVQLDWACQPSQRFTAVLACGDPVDAWTTNMYTSSYLADSLGNTYPAGADPLIGSATITATGALGSTVNYNLYCSAGGVNTLNATVPVQITAAIMSISGNPQSVQSGSASTISYSAVNASSCTVTGPGVSQNYPSLATDFSYTGANQSYTVPAGVSSIFAALWGGGGGGGNVAGGGGGYTMGGISVTPGSVLTFIIGQGGVYGGGATYGGGGASGGTYSGAGGGRTAIRDSSGTELITAGGGGGGGLGGGSLGGNNGGGDGGAGGGQSGVSVSGGGAGGGQSGGGSGVQFAGSGGSSYAGGGGGGWYGGAGGPTYSSAGGGSGHCDAGASNCNTLAGSGTATAGGGAPSGVGIGGAAYSTGGAGYIRLFGGVSSSVSTGALSNPATYTLTCIDPAGTSQSVSTTVTVIADTCPTAVGDASGEASGFRLDPNAAKRNISATQCITNTSGSTYFIPKPSKATDFSNFITAVSNGQVPGVSLFGR